MEAQLPRHSIRKPNCASGIVGDRICRGVSATYHNFNLISMDYGVNGLAASPGGLKVHSKADAHLEWM